MNNVTIKLNSAGIRELLKSDEMQAVITEYCNRVAQNAGGSGYNVNVRAGRKRAVGEVHAMTTKALDDTYKNNSLLKALHK